MVEKNPKLFNFSINLAQMMAARGHCALWSDESQVHCHIWCIILGETAVLSENKTPTGLEKSAHPLVMTNRSFGRTSKKILLPNLFASDLFTTLKHFMVFITLMLIWAFYPNCCGIC